MKNISINILAAALLLLLAAGCRDNENWKIVTDIQQGFYVAGEATVYSAVAPAASFGDAPLSPRDGETAEQFPGMYSKFTWLKAGKEFTIAKVDASGATADLGKGSTVAGETVALASGGAGFTVASDGLYFLVLNSKDNHLTVLATPWVVAGSATPGGWNEGTPLAPSFDESSLTASFTASLPLLPGEMKFRFINWEIVVPYGSADVRLFTNMGSVEENNGDAKISSSSLNLKDGGKNIGVVDAAQYDLTLSFDVKSAAFAASAEKGEAIELPEYPDAVYMIGAEFGNWDWESPDVAELTPVNGTPGHFWCVRRFSAGAPFKWAPGKEWKGDFSGSETNEGFTQSDGNAVVAANGVYSVYIDLENKKITIEPAKVYGMGDCFGGWNAGQYPFVAENGKMKIATAAAGNLRMYATSSGTGAEWWQMEFMVFNGKIEYRGNGGDQTSVAVEAGKTVTLDFNAGTGNIE
ncbi:MAG: SusF/SusE family outer membrane protein [Prevotellaceae bacterium]|jgi:hypothetical protein|nr:SusF/SusE family outer membrane protein [Prevotellaceae bacterium]